MFKGLWNSFVPTPDNEYRPYFLRAWPVALTLVVILGLYGGAQWAERSLETPGSSLAAVVSAVLVDLANTDRADNNLQSLAVNPTLQEVAQMKADDMAAKSYFCAQRRPLGPLAVVLVSESRIPVFVRGRESRGLLYRLCGRQPGMDELARTSRQPLCRRTFTEIGIATAQGVYQGQPTTFVVQGVRDAGHPDAAADSGRHPRLRLPQPRSARHRPKSLRKKTATTTRPTPGCDRQRRIDDHRRGRDGLA